MTVATSLRAADNLSATPTEALDPTTRFTSVWKRVFIGPNGLRAGWRALIFLAVFGVLFGGFALIRAGGLQSIREQYRNQSHITITPFLLGGSEAIALLFLSVAALAMSRLEHRKFGDYGLPLRKALGKDFWIGSLSGFLAISGTLLAMFLLHGFHITGLALHGTAIVSSLVAWGIAFLLAALVEEFLCRGYLQYTLASGIGFWPAACVLSGLFAFGHAFNANETAVGVLTTGLFSLLFCLLLLRTGNLWIAVGFHAAWDWGQTFYGVPDSGIVPYHSLFASSFSGPRWLTGGIVGPEASVLCPIALLVAALIFNRYYRQTRSPIQRPDSTPAQSTSVTAP
jgi:uncharacterized protein